MDHFRSHIGGETEDLDLLTHDRAHVADKSLNVFVVDAESGVFVETRERFVLTLVYKVNKRLSFESCIEFTYNAVRCMSRRGRVY
jgi:hypothetical protein